MEANAWYVGCACDRRYVSHTATMLASLDINGRVPEARVLVASFGLNEEDHRVLRAGAGALAKGMIIHEVGSELIAPISTSRWTNEYPPAVIGRLFLADLIQEQGARLLTIDSDMIVNVSLRPLFGMNLFGSYVAACHDVPRHEDLNYFNSGIMLLEVDKYKSFDVARRALSWLSEQEGQVSFPDQDALNEVVGHVWSRLDHRWNFHCNYGEERAVTSNDYERSYVAHFAAKKPWNDPTHPGLSLYRRYREELTRRLEIQALLADKADASFVAICCQVLLGREPRGESEYSMYEGLGSKGIVTRIVKSDEFLRHVLLPFITNEAFSPDRFLGQPQLCHRLWAAQRLNLTPIAIQSVHEARSWAALLVAILHDSQFRRWSSNVHLMNLADMVASKTKSRDDAVSARP